ncbi:MAG: AraC family transcriptional regulator [Alphaproteobacteria bacterium]|nr:MAG: AraC family transcriptional regulator [Alphaproteobacteria bacterium]
MAWIVPFVRLLLSALLMASASYLAVQSLGRSLHGRLACLLLLTVGAAVLIGDATLLQTFGPMRWPLLALGGLAPFAFWLTANGFFVDGFRLNVLHIWLFLVTIGLALAPELLQADPELSGLAHYAGLAVGFAFVLHGTMKVWLGLATDLDPGRFRFRARYTILPLVYLALVGCHEILLAVGPSGLAHASHFLNGVYLTGSAIYLSLLLHHYVRSQDGRKLRKQLMPHESFSRTLSADEASQLQRLSEQLQHRRVYTDDQMSLASLAALADVPVSSARRLLCGAYGYRNFNKLLDGFRVKTAKSYLSDVDAAHMPIRDIAAIVGYRNESGLIQAFLRLEKETPAGYRQRAIEESAAATRLHLTNTDR